MQTTEIKGHIVEFIPETHQYIVDGILTPCVSNILAFKFNDYANIPPDILKRASDLGTELHKAIEDYERDGVLSDHKEFKNYLYIKGVMGFENIDNELPVIYEREGRVLYVGTLDQIILIDGELGINDFKRVCRPNKEKIAYQLNFYKMAYEQTYGKTIKHLSFTHLRENKREFCYLPINEETAISLLNEFLESEM